MDFIVRYFKQGKVASRYLTSAFLGPTCAEDLKKKFDEVSQKLDHRKLRQIPMGGLNANWKFMIA